MRKDSRSVRRLGFEPEAFGDDRVVGDLMLVERGLAGAERVVNRGKLFVGGGEFAALAFEQVRWRRRRPPGCAGCGRRVPRRARC